MKFWNGSVITTLASNEIFVFGSNPEGRHGAGAAKAAIKFGARYGCGRGLYGQTYALVTKNLSPGFKEASTGILYHKEGYRSVSKEMIRENIRELYECARNHPDKDFLITYQYEIYPNGSPKKSLNGYDSQEFLEMLVIDQDIPENIVFHSSYENRIPKVLTAKKEIVKEPVNSFEFDLFDNFMNNKF